MAFVILSLAATAISVVSHS